MISIKPGMSMMHGGNRMAAAFVELKSIGLPRERCPEFSKKICDYISSEFQIPMRTGSTSRSRTLIGRCSAGADGTFSSIARCVYPGVFFARLFCQMLDEAVDRQAYLGQYLPIKSVGLIEGVFDLDSRVRPG